MICICEERKKEFFFFWLWGGEGIREFPQKLMGYKCHFQCLLFGFSLLTYSIDRYICISSKAFFVFFFFAPCTFLLFLTPLLHLRGKKKKHFYIYASPSWFSLYCSSPPISMCHSWEWMTCLGGLPVAILEKRIGRINSSRSSVICCTAAIVHNKRACSIFFFLGEFPHVDIIED